MQGWIDLIARLLVYFIFCWFIYRVAKKIKKHFSKNKNVQEVLTEDSTHGEPSVQSITAVEYSKAYEPQYLMTLNERNQFRKLYSWAQQNEFIVFTKVRLLDLIAPRKGQDNYKGLLWKIQAKHVDFVICDSNIKVRCIVEISDNSHNRQDRQERDKFVVDVLQACGYKVLQTYNISEEQLDRICGINMIAAAEEN